MATHTDDVGASSPAESEALPTNYRWVIAFALTTANWGMSLPMVSFGLLLPSIREDLNLSPLQEGWLGGALQIGSITTMLVAVAALSRKPPRRLFLFSTGVGALCVFSMGLSISFAMLLLSRMSFGLVSSARVPGRALFVQQWFPRKEYPIVSGVTIGFIGIAEFIALATTPFIVDKMGSWRIALFIFGGVNASIFLFWVFFGRERKTPDYERRLKASPPVSLRSALGYKQLWLAGLTGMGVSFGWAGFANFWPSYQLEAHNISLQKSGFLFGIVSLSSVPSGVLLGILAAKRDDRRPLIWTCGVIVICAMLGLALLDNYWQLTLCVLAMGAAWGFMPLLFTMPYEVPNIPVTHVASGTALVSVLVALGGTLGPIVAGTITDLTGSRFIALLVCACTSVTMLLFSIPIRPRVRQTIS